MVTEAPLDIDGGPRGRRGFREDRQETVAQRRLDVAAVVGDRMANDLVVVSKDVHPTGAKDAGESRRSLDVGD
jgi:hypothetical protein